MHFLDEKNIFFTLEYKQNRFPVRVARNEYHSLMCLISDHLAPDGFGLCSGMGSCGTCMVTICDNEYGGRETTLSCDIAVNDELANTIIIVSEPF